MLRAFAKLAGAVDLRGLLTLAGLGLASYGASLSSLAAGLCLAGGGLFYLGALHPIVSRLVDALYQRSR